MPAKEEYKAVGCSFWHRVGVSQIAATQASLSMEFGCPGFTIAAQQSKDGAKYFE